MQRFVRPALLIVFVLCLLALAVILLNPSARRLAPTWLVYDLIVRQGTSLPADAERWVLAQGQEFCNVGRDSDCGGYKIVRVQSLAIGPAARSQGASAAWCVDYVVRRRNTSRLTGWLIYWANDPRAMIVAEQNASQYELYPVERCDMTVLSP